MKRRSSYLLGFICLQLLLGCENPMVFNTTVHEDGSLGLNMSIEVKDTLSTNPNIFGIDNEVEWEVSYDTVDLKERKYHKSYSKTFESDMEWNASLDNPVDSLFRIHADFEKQFKWFYTYINYSQTFRAINRFKEIDFNEFLTKEDFQFIGRLPAMGKNISLADSLYLAYLNERIYEEYVTQAMVKEEQLILKELVNKNNLGEEWIEAIDQNSAAIKKLIDKAENKGNEILYIIDSLKIPISKEEASLYLASSDMLKNYQSRLNFMSYANDGKYYVTVNMPLDLVESNADSLFGNTLIWKPLVTKFLFKDYKMYAESRKLNYWAVIVSVAVVLITIGLFLKKDSFNKL